ncbi:hypothetical protein EIKCOROL_02355 [Eikenella corrodens ATCC 23834]|uniref:Uncharacterized protein n=1 Tax=Eikenella corrodens ATCC 23834 TaxID=546274 RepID=C0DY93_EIKCO|nr:hypothetical protein EIKCOROL_02355 [Eikenella corrodens ATCC 23834]
MPARCSGGRLIIHCYIVIFILNGRACKPYGNSGAAKPPARHISCVEALFSGSL